MAAAGSDAYRADAADKRNAAAFYLKPSGLGTYPPYDEDFGYVTLEAFLARKPVVTCTDSGGPNEFVVDGVNGYVCEPSAAALADALGRLAADRRRAAALGDAGHEVARRITWDGVIETLIG